MEPQNKPMGGGGVPIRQGTTTYTLHLHTAAQPSTASSVQRQGIEGHKVQGTAQGALRVQGRA